MLSGPPGANSSFACASRIVSSPNASRCVLTKRNCRLSASLTPATSTEIHPRLTGSGIDAADQRRVLGLKFAPAGLADLHLAVLLAQDHVAHRQTPVELGTERRAARGVGPRRGRPAAPRRTPPGRGRPRSCRRACRALPAAARGSRTSPRWQAAPGPVGGAPRSDGICCRQSATSWSPTRSASDSSISLASGTARSGKFVARSSFQITPPPSTAAGMSGADSAGPRSAPR